MYDYRIFYGHIVQGDLIGAVDYLKSFPGKKATLNKYLRIFDKGSQIKHSKNPVLNSVCLIFDEYYRNVFWLKVDTLKAVQRLCDGFCELLSTSKQCFSSIQEAEEAWEVIEEKVKRLVEAQGYHYVGGKTQGFYGPYIWKDTKRTIYKVKLPYTVEDFPLDMMTGFICCSWMSHISFGRIGTGGWGGDDGVLSCVKKRYRYRRMTSRFKIDFLKHEAQHVLDKRQFPGISSTHMEYRAKLVQLIYAKSMKSFWGFVSEASKEDINNSHVVASYLLVRNLSQLMFNESFVSDLTRWKGKMKHIRIYARGLYDNSPKDTDFIIDSF